jgi:hypothetical protein
MIDFGFIRLGRKVPVKEALAEVCRREGSRPPLYEEMLGFAAGYREIGEREAYPILGLGSVVQVGERLAVAFLSMVDNKQILGLHLITEDCPPEYNFLVAYE